MKATVKSYTTHNTNQSNKRRMSHMSVNKNVETMVDTTLGYSKKYIDLIEGGKTKSRRGIGEIHKWRSSVQRSSEAWLSETLEGIENKYEELRMLLDNQVASLLLVNSSLTLRLQKLEHLAATAPHTLSSCLPPVHHQPAQFTLDSLQPRDCSPCTPPTPMPDSLCIGSRIRELGACSASSTSLMETEKMLMSILFAWTTNQPKPHLYVKRLSVHLALVRMIYV